MIFPVTIFTSAVNLRHAHADCNRLPRMHGKIGISDPGMGSRRPAPPAIADVSRYLVTARVTKTDRFARDPASNPYDAREIIVFRSSPSSSMDPVRQRLAIALRDYRADVQRCLLGWAYARSQSAEGKPIGALEERPSLLSSLALPDPGGWAGAAAVLLAGPSAQRLEALGIDAGVLAMAEVRRIELADVGPASGILRIRGTHSPAWTRVRDAVSVRGSAALATRVATQLDHHGERLLPAIRRCLEELHDMLAGEGIGLMRLAAAHERSGGAFVSHEPAAVQGAPGWEIHMRIEPTVDGVWLVTAQRRWMGTGPEPAAPVIVLTLRASDGSEARQVNRRIEEAFAIWYEDRPFGPEPRLSAHSTSGP